MKWVLMLLGVFVFMSNTVSGSARFFNSSGADLGIYTDIQCNAGMTCSVSSGQMGLVAAPLELTMTNGETLTNDVDDTVQVTSDDSDMNFQIMGFEAQDAVLTFSADESDDNGDDWEAKAATGGDFTLSNDSSGSQIAQITVVGTTSQVVMIGGLQGDGGEEIAGFRRKVVSVTTSATANLSQCGATYVNTNASVLTLPEASVSQGCRYTFIVGNASNFDINPADGTDQILLLTDAGGDAVRNATIGQVLVLEALASNSWAPVSGTQGSIWLDVD
jgi:hypothetical protein